MTDVPERREGTSGPLVLLVGGARDGEWVPDHRMPELHTRVARRNPDSPVPILNPIITRERYLRALWTRPDGSEEVPLYHHESLTLTGALLRLMVHYKPKG